jgi:hypothetical protein
MNKPKQGPGTLKLQLSACSPDGFVFRVRHPGKTRHPMYAALPYKLGGAANVDEEACADRVRGNRTRYVWDCEYGCE